jgi:hypothetical protein
MLAESSSKCISPDNRTHEKDLRTEAAPGSGQKKGVLLKKNIKFNQSERQVKNQRFSTSKMGPRTKQLGEFSPNDFMARRENSQLNQMNSTNKTIQLSRLNNQSQPGARVQKYNLSPVSRCDNNPIGTQPVNGLNMQFEQWQRPPSRQKEPNQAIGLDLDDPARPKTRGKGKGLAPKMNLGETRQFNIQSDFAKEHPNLKNNFFLTQQVDSSSSGNGPKSLSTNVQAKHTRFYSNNLQQKSAKPGNRSRRIEFFNQRQNKSNDFNSTDETMIKPYTTHKMDSSMVRGPNQGQAAVAANLQRPPSRHKDPPQNLGLDLYPPGMAVASPNEFDQPGAISSDDMHGNYSKSVGRVFSEFDIEYDRKNAASIEMNNTRKPEKARIRQI